MSGHLDENAVVEMLQGALSRGRVAAIEEHVDQCGACRRLVSEVARNNLAPPPADADSEWESDEDPTLANDGSEEPTVFDLKIARELPPGKVIDERFRILRRLGQGGIGVVYKAQDLELELPVALKFLRPEISSDPALERQLLQEIVLGRRISHPNVCRLYDLGRWRGTHFISMEFVDGESLDLILARGSPPADHAVAILIQIARALEAAHLQGVIHRDLKPGNIMLTPDGRVIVMDFGLAEDLTKAPNLRAPIVAVGTPAYWAPEQARHEPPDQRTDFYAFGLIACELFSGIRHGFDDRTALEHPIPPQYRPIVGRCLEVDRAARFQTATALREAMEDARTRGPRRARSSWVKSIAPVKKPPAK